MSTKDFDFPAALEALVQQVCKEQGLPRRRLDEIRQLVEIRAGELAGVLPRQLRAVRRRVQRARR